MSVAYTLAGQYGAEPLLSSAGALLASTPVSVYIHNTTTLAALYTDSSKGTSAPNPTESDSIGNLTFWAQPGLYDLVPSGESSVSVMVPADPADPALADATALQGVPLSATAPTTSQGLLYNGTDWAPVSDVVNVKAYGATGNGTTDDTAAINNAITACVGAGGGVVYFPPGTYLTSTGISVANTQAAVHLVGAGEDATIVKASSSAFAATAVCVHQANGWIVDMTFDGNGATTEALEFSNPSGQATFTLTQGACRVTARNALGSWVMVVWDRNQTYQIDRFSFVDVTVAGPGNTAGDNFAVSYVNRCSVADLTFTGLERTPNFFVINQLTADGIFCDGATNTGALVFDAGVATATVTNLQVIASSSARESSVWVNAPLALFTNCVLGVGCAWYLNPTGTAGVPVVRLVNCDSGFGVALSNPVAELSVIGGRLAHPSASGDSAIVDGSPANSTTALVRVTDAVLDGGNGTQTVFRSSNAVTWTLLAVIGGKAQNFSGMPASIVTNITLGAGSYTRSLVGVNPVGAVTVTVPSSGTAVTAQPYDRTFYVTAASSGTTTLAIGGGPTVTVPPAACVPVGVPAGATLTPTYTTAPTWVVEGL